MTDEELAAIKAMLETHGKPYDPDGEFWTVPGREQLLRLVAEVERLREIARAVANFSSRPVGAITAEYFGDCPFCRIVVHVIFPPTWLDATPSRDDIHTPDCPVAKARALLGKEDT